MDNFGLIGLTEIIITRNIGAAISNFQELAGAILTDDNWNS